MKSGAVSRWFGWWSVFAVIGVLCTANSPAGEEFRKSELIELIRLDPTFHLDIRYATTNNFVGRAVYPEARAFLQKPVAEALVRVHQKLRKAGYGLVIFDGYRPRRVVRIFWEAMPDNLKQFVADPDKVSVHSRGCAVDLTLYEIKSGQPVMMPGGFDEWTNRSHSLYEGGPTEPRRMRDRLRHAMEAEEFLPAELEWWHYTHPDWGNYPALDLPFSEIPR